MPLSDTLCASQLPALTESSHRQQPNSKIVLPPFVFCIRPKRNFSMSYKRSRSDPEVKEGVKKIRVDDSPQVTIGNSSAGGSYNKEEDAWEWEVVPHLKLRVSKFKGQPRVDIRHLMNGHYTKKGVSLTLEAFEAIRSWDKYEDALKALSAKKD
eukprot:Gregarina_sp_Poly_1__8014@NODE_45_length_17866_cov_75_803753_g39_i0_p8_GENE_NODE_45_length_17866_cov_75_803753_g39_i0NODE_45_length_17866_cov_75_803753_g39_i0_p8_ORF_typecomplete_len154_score21_27PC4/PF02229_16/1_3e07_NODE_45_length_17866_cov_75_803753_g39_i01084611307